MQIEITDTGPYTIYKRSPDGYTVVVSGTGPETKTVDETTLGDDENFLVIPGPTGE